MSCGCEKLIFSPAFFRVAENITQERGPKKEKGSKKWGSKARRESSDESEADSEDSNDGVVEIMDCIEVEM